MEKARLKSLLISIDTNLKHAIQKLNETAEKILFVTDVHGKLIGTVTDGDIRRAIICGDLLTIPVEKIMHKNFISINKRTPDIREKAKELMQRYVIEQIPVIDNQGLIVDVILWIDCLSPGSELQDATRAKLENSVVIMAGGEGKRLDPFTKIFPKPLVPLHNKPIIEHIIDRFYKHGFYKFVLIVNYKKEMIRMYFCDNDYPYEIEFVEENEYYGTAGGLFLLKERLKETFVVTNCDTILEGDYKGFINWHKENQYVMTVVGSHKEILVPYGVINIKDGSFTAIDEKPKLDLFINTGTYVFTPDVFDLLDDYKFLDMDDLIIKVKDNFQNRIGVYPHWGGWFDLGQWDEYKNSLRYLGGSIDDI